MKSLRKAINDKCRDCNYDEMDKGSWLFQTTTCCSKSCPLWEVRPRQRISSMSEKTIALLSEMGDTVILEGDLA